MKRKDFFRSLAALFLIPVLPKPKPVVQVHVGKGFFEYAQYGNIKTFTPKQFTIDKLEAEFHKQTKAWAEKDFSYIHDLLMKRFKRLDNETINLS